MKIEREQKKKAKESKKLMHRAKKEIGKIMRMNSI